MTATVSDRKTASAMEWVTSSVVVTRSVHIRSSSRLSRWRGHLVQRAERLVEEQDPRLGAQARGRSNPLAHPARELRPGRAFSNPCSPTSSIRSWTASSEMSRPLTSMGKVYVRPDRPPRQQGGVLEGDPEVMVSPGDRRRLPMDQSSTAGRLLEIGEHPEDRRLAAPRRAEQSEERALWRGQIDVVDRGDGAAPEAEHLGQSLDADPVDQRGVADIALRGI